MLQLHIPETELFDEQLGCFFIVRECTLKLEHSLISVSKWESKWKRPFIDPINKRTVEETVDYIKCMTIDSGVDPNVYRAITNDMVNKVNAYISDPMSAFKPKKKEGQGSMKKVITSEDIYYWMIAGEIPFECQKWHLNRLLSLVSKVSEETEKAKNTKKMPKGKVASNYAAINAARRQALGTKG